MGKQDRRCGHMLLSAGRPGHRKLWPVFETIRQGHALGREIAHGALCHLDATTASICVKQSATGTKGRCTSAQLAQVFRRNRCGRRDFRRRPRKTAIHYLTTWLGEHQNESDMAFYSTQPFEHIVGPGIGRAEYGGLMMTLPPHRLFDVWQDPDYDMAETKAERLLMAALDYSMSVMSCT